MMGQPWIFGPRTDAEAGRRPEQASTPQEVTGGADKWAAWVGEALDGAVRITWNGWRVDNVFIAPHLLDRGASSLAEAVRDATNAAVEKSMTDAVGSAGEWGRRYEGFLDEAQDTLRRQLEEATRATEANISALRRISEQHLPPRR